MFDLDCLRHLEILLEAVQSMSDLCMPLFLWQQRLAPLWVKSVTSSLRVETTTYLFYHILVPPPSPPMPIKISNGGFPLVLAFETCNYIRARLTHDNYFSFGNKMFNLKVRNEKPNFLYLDPLLWWLFPTIYGTYLMEEDSTTSLMACHSHH